MYPLDSYKTPNMNNTTKLGKISKEKIHLQEQIASSAQ